MVISTYLLLGLHVSMIIHSVVATVAFENAKYNASENTTAHIALVLNKPLSTEVTIKVFNSDVTAIGKMLSCYCYSI